MNLALRVAVFAALVALGTGFLGALFVSSPVVSGTLPSLYHPQFGWAIAEAGGGAFFTSVITYAVVSARLARGLKPLGALSGARIALTSLVALAIATSIQMGGNGVLVVVAFALITAGWFVALAGAVGGWYVNHLVAHTEIWGFIVQPRVNASGVPSDLAALRLPDGSIVEAPVVSGLSLFPGSRVTLHAYKALGQSTYFIAAVEP